MKRNNMEYCDDGCRTAMTFTNVVLPLYCSPTSVNSISSFQNNDLNQSKIRFINASILDNTR